MSRPQTLAVNDSTDIEALDFETAVAALDASVQELEAGDLPLEQAIAVYARGVKLAERCSALLSAAELELREIGGPGDDSVPH